MWSCVLSDSLLMENIQKYHTVNVEIEVDDYTSRFINPPKKQQIHCALEEEPDCHFQCETMEELNKHIANTHPGKKNLQCSQCL